jgi:type IV pilus assembly protein PilY1
MKTKLIKHLSFCLIGTLGIHSEVYSGTIASVPLFLTTPTKSNTLVILDSSNSMDEDPSGAAVGSNSADSKSEIARKVIRELINNYTGQINMGLMSYQQQSVVDSYLHNSPYDVTFNSANYNPAFTGARDSLTKRFRKENPTNLNNYVYYNVALPFYNNGGSQGNGFCYAPSAKAFNNGEDPATGPWDTYRCYSSKTSTNDIWDVLPANTWANGFQENALGLSGLFYNGLLNPTDSDYAQGILDFGKQITWYYVGRTYFSNSSPGRGILNNPIRLLDSTQGTALNTNLACNIPTTPAPCTANGIKNAGLTPIEGTLLTAQDYFAGNLASAAEGYASSGSNITYPLPQSCNKNFIIMITDGLPSTDKNGNLAADPAVAIAAAASAASNLKAAGVQTYVVGFALPTGTDPKTLDTIAQAGGTNSALSATDYASLSSALDKIYKDIISKQNSFSTLANNGPQISTSSLLYQTTFDATDWSGNVNAFIVNADGSLSASPTWQAANKIPAATDRNILTFNPSAPSNGVKGVAFQWANLTSTPSGTSQQDYLNTLSGLNDSKGQDRVKWLRGDQTKEKSNGGTLRNRVNVLGDIVNSNPVYISNAEDYDFGKLAGTEGLSYTTFRASSAYTSRIPMLYVGANDGMLHGFDAQKSSTGGTEKLAYIPNALFPQLSKLTSPNYSKQAYVDGKNATSDAYVNTDGNGAAWHTLLTSTTGGGAKALFTLDVTSPSAFGNSSVLWEFNNSNDADLGYTLAQPAIVRMHDGSWAVIVANGYNSTNGKAVLFILNAATGAVIKKIDTGTGSVGTPNGLSSPLAVDIDNDRIIDIIYAGDLLGNLWKFDVSSNTATSWDVAYKSGSTALPLFVACVNAGTACSTTDRQPITAKPTLGPVGTDQGTGFMVYFGTGKYFETTDNVVGSTPQPQAFYGLWDKNTKVASTDQITDLANLQSQTIDLEGHLTSVDGIVSTQNLRVVSANDFCYTTASASCTTVSTSALKKGWYLKLLTPPAPGTAKGERVISKAALFHKTIIFSTATPKSDLCSAGGNSWLMLIDSITGQRKKKAVFDVFGKGTNTVDGQVDNSDMITSNNVSMSPAGIDQEIGITGDPDLMIFNTGSSITNSNENTVTFSSTGGSTPQLTNSDSSGGKATTHTSGTTGETGTEYIQDQDDPNIGIRRSWRQLR